MTKARKLNVPDHAKIVSYGQLIATLRRRRQELGLPHLETDMRAGLHAGYTGKVECGSRRLGPVSLPSLLGVLRVALVVVDENGRILSAAEPGTYPLGNAQTLVHQLTGRSGSLWA